MPAARPLIERLFEKFYVDDNGCWIWTAATRHGYGVIGIAAQKVGLAHRLSYEFIVGPIPPGLQLDHLCRVRACINPFHLEPVTNQVNAARSPLIGRASKHMRKRDANGRFA